MQIKLFLFALSLFTSPGMASENVLTIDLLRESDTGTLHTAVRCKSDCQVIQTVQGAKVYSTTLKREVIQKLLDGAFKTAPSREVASGRPALQRIGGSPLHWRFYDGSKTVQGGFSMHPSEQVERERAALYQAVLQAEAVLEQNLARWGK